MATTTAAAPAARGNHEMRKVRITDDLWSRAGARASEEDTNLSALIRQWLTDYADTGSPIPTSGRRPVVRMTAAERKKVRDAFMALSEVAVDDMLAAINSDR